MYCKLGMPITDISDYNVQQTYPSQSREKETTHGNHKLKAFKTTKLVLQKTPEGILHTEKKISAM